MPLPREQDRLAAIAEEWRPFAVRVARHWCRRSALDPEDLVQDAFARMAERRVFPASGEQAKYFVLRWLGRAWDSYWQNQRAAKRADADRETASLDRLTAPHETGDDAVPGFQPRAGDDVEAAVVEREIAGHVGRALANLPPLALAALTGPGDEAVSRFTRSRDRQWARNLLRAQLERSWWAA